MPNFGCPPGDTLMECWDGSCAISNATCNEGCNASLVKCWNGVCNASCEGPYWNTPIPTYNFSVTVPVFGTSNYLIYHIYKQDPITTSDIMGILLISNEQDSPYTINATVQGVDYYDLYYQNIGPIAWWSNWSNPAFLLSSIININSDVMENPTDDNQTINILFKEQQRIEQIGLCFAIIDDWYWDPLDNQTFSPFASLDLFTKYRNGSYDTIVTPPKRWRCLDSPQVTLQDPPYLAVLNLKGLKINTWGSYALIQDPNFTNPNNGDETAPTPPQYPIIGAGCVLFVVILVAMLIAHATDDNSPTCSKK